MGTDRRTATARYKGKCSLCGLTYPVGAEIIRTKPRKRSMPNGRYVTYKWAHEQCAEAWKCWPDWRELVRCPKCGRRIQWGKLPEHLLWAGGVPECEHYSFGAGQTEVELAIRDFLYERAGIGEVRAEGAGG